VPRARCGMAIACALALTKLKSASSARRCRANRCKARVVAVLSAPARAAAAIRVRVRSAIRSPMIRWPPHPRRAGHSTSRPIRTSAWGTRVRNCRMISIRSRRTATTRRSGADFAGRFSPIILPRWTTRWLRRRSPATRRRKLAGSFRATICCRTTGTRICWKASRRRNHRPRVWPPRVWPPRGWPPRGWPPRGWRPRGWRPKGLRPRPCHHRNHRHSATQT